MTDDRPTEECVARAERILGVRLLEDAAGRWVARFPQSHPIWKALRLRKVAFDSFDILEIGGGDVARKRKGKSAAGWLKRHRAMSKKDKAAKPLPRDAALRREAYMAEQRRLIGDQIRALGGANHNSQE